MAMLKRRTRIMTFRLAEEEFEQIKNLCIAEGARSISDYARNLLCNLAVAKAAPNDAGLDARVGRLDRKVEELDRAIQELTRIVSDRADTRPKSKAVPASQGQ